MIACIDFHPVKLPSTALLFDIQSPPVMDNLVDLPLELQPNIIPLTRRHEFYLRPDLSGDI